MDFRRITINIAGRNYPLNVPAAEEETLRKVGKQIETMIKDFEASFDVRDKQDALAMCALKLGTNAEVYNNIIDTGTGYGIFAGGRGGSHFYNNIIRTKLNCC